MIVNIYGESNDWDLSKWDFMKLVKKMIEIGSKVEQTEGLGVYCNIVMVFRDLMIMKNCVTLSNSKWYGGFSKQRNFWSVNTDLFFVTCKIQPEYVKICYKSLRLISAKIMKSKGKVNR